MAISTDNTLPQGFLLLEEPGFADPDAKDRPNRLCICFSDVHFTDGTVGNQSADEVVWEEVFDSIMDLCVDYGVEELTLLLVGDVADMIRTKQWTEGGVYPWQRDHPEFKPTLRKIMEGIIKIHAKSPAACEKTGFFYLLQNLPKALSGYDYRNDHGESRKSQVKRVRTLVFLGNHDKEILADEETLRMFYEGCLGQPVECLSDGYREWIGEMYFGDKGRYLDPERKTVPWLPFYWGDRGFRLFVTHGQWRDKDNSRSIVARGEKPGWEVDNGWRLDTWRALEYKPFTEACFGDTIAAGLLSGFIYRAKNKLEPIEQSLRDSGQLGPSNQDAEKTIRQLKRVLDELDLYRPTAAAIQRIIKETCRLRTMNSQFGMVRTMIEGELLDSIRTWLGCPFTFESATPKRRKILCIAKPVVNFMKLFGARVELWFLYWLMDIFAKLQQWHRSAPSYKEMLDFPAFMKQYRRYGFRIHGEGHTHIPLEEELYFDDPFDRQNYTYVNFGAWRDQLVSKKNKQGCRRLGVGRILCILDCNSDPQCPEQDSEGRFTYWVQDVLSWSDKADRF